jgi:catechol 2,3-dioxygenase-like lactoylglutathione lyase family enzyme
VTVRPTAEACRPQLPEIAGGVLARVAKVKAHRQLRSVNRPRTEDSTIDAAPNISLFCVELRTPQWDRMIEWYRDILGMTVVLCDDSGGYALLEAAGARLSILAREETGPKSDRWSLSFEVNEMYAVTNRLAASHSTRTQLRLNKEGFQECVVADPDGNKVRIFAWCEPPPDAKPGRKSTSQPGRKSKSGSKSR